MSGAARLARRRSAARLARRRPAAGQPVPDRDEYFDRWSVLHGGYDPRGSRWVAPWLSVAYVVARPLARARVPPDAVTGGGLLVSGAAVGLCALGPRWALAGALVVVASGLLDSLDGAVALLQERTSRWGQVLDSAVDRLSDLLYLAAFAVLGAPPAVCAAGGALMFLLEYLRARAAVAGMTEIGVVTVWERGTRVVVTAMFLLGAGLYADPRWATLGAAAWVGLGLVGTTQLLAVIKQKLR